MYKCLDCGHIFDRGEEGRETELIGSFWGDPAYQTISFCPICKGAYEETKQCEICGGEFLGDELEGGVCHECLEEYRHDFEMCRKISIGNTTEVELDSLIASILEPSDINAILTEYIRERMPNVDCGEFISQDPSWFGENLVKEVKKR